MQKFRFVIVDVFTDQPLTGNPLAVFPDAENLDATQMQSIAREFNFSETTFVMPARDAKTDWRLRCFSPTAEVFGAGHNALGAWWVLAAEGVVRPDKEIVTTWQELGDRVLPVEIYFQDDRPLRVAMTQDKPHFGDTLTDLESLAKAVGLTVSDLNVHGLKPQAVSTGATHLLTPVNDLAALSRVQINADELIKVARPLGCQGCYLFSRETIDQNSAAHARAFFPGIGITEDPATGSAAGPLGAYLASHKLISEDTWTVIEQGDEMRRSSRIEVRVTGDQVKVAGRCAILAEGSLSL